MPSSPAESLSATIQAGPDASWCGDLQDISLQGARVLFHTKPPALPMGAEVVLVLEGPRLVRPFHLECEVVSRHELVPGGRTYALEFFEPHRVARVLEIVFQRLFNRRSTLRVSPRSEDELSANLRSSAEGTWWAAHVLNLSTLGLGLSTRIQADGDLGSTEVVSVHLRMPEDQDIVLTGHIRSRRMVSEALVYGISLDRSIPGEEEARVVLAEYTERRRKELEAIEADDEDTIR